MAVFATLKPIKGIEKQGIVLGRGWDLFAICFALLLSQQKKSNRNRFGGKENKMEIRFKQELNGGITC